MVRLRKKRVGAAFELRTERMVGILAQNSKRYLESKELKA